MAARFFYVYHGKQMKHTGSHHKQSVPTAVYVQSADTQQAAKIEQAFHRLCTELNAQGSIKVVHYPQPDEKMEKSDEPIKSW